MKYYRFYPTGGETEKAYIIEDYSRLNGYRSYINVEGRTVSEPVPTKIFVPKSQCKVIDDKFYAKAWIAIKNRIIEFSDEVIDIK